jgi:hypothetical protein
MAAPKKSPKPSKTTKAKVANKKYIDAGLRKILSQVDYKALAGMGSEGPKKRKPLEGPKKRKPKPKITYSARKSR